MVSSPCEGAEEYGDCSSRLMGGGTGLHDRSDTEGRHVMTFYYRRPSTPLGGEQTLLPLESLFPTPQAPGNLEEPTRREWTEESREGEEWQLLYFPAFLSWCRGGEGGPVPWTLTCGVFFADFHEVRPTEVETERQDRSQRQAELGWGGSGVPAPDRGVHLHQGSVSSPPLLVFLPHGWVARGWGSVSTTCARYPHLQTLLCTPSPWRRPLLPRRVGREEHGGSVPGLSPMLPVRLPCPSLTRSQNSKGSPRTCWSAA